MVLTEPADAGEKRAKDLKRHKGIKEHNARRANTHPTGVGRIAYQENTHGNRGQTALGRVEA